MSSHCKTLSKWRENFIPKRRKQNVRLANSKAGIKPTAPLSAFDKENLIEFSLDSVHYLYKQSNPNPVPSILRSPMSQLALARPLLQFKRKEKKKKNNIQN